ncbi:MAG: hypothetical protein MJZ01_05740 [Bacteroidales bacterium]|nr:hypothetical protein [Bacteroidales bacterium]
MREEILHKTRRGFDIYRHIVYLMTGYDMKLMPSVTRPEVVPNPWDGGQRSLVLRLRPTLNSNIVMHVDESGKLREGNAFDFAEKYYKRTGDELYRAINEEMKLHVGEEYDLFLGTYVPCDYETRNAIHSAESNQHKGEDGRFSYFRSPIRNIMPYKDITLEDVYKVIVGPYFEARTKALRGMMSADGRRVYKANAFDYCTFGGTFGERRAGSLKELSGLMVLDFDHVRSVEELRDVMKAETTLDVRLLFRSPSGDGLKAVIGVDVKDAKEYGEMFDEVRDYMADAYGYEVDRSGRDVCRACFIPWDPEAVMITKT